MPWANNPVKGSIVMSLDTDHVLILGDPADPMVIQWRDYCVAADVTVDLYIDPEQPPPPTDTPYTVLINTHVEIPFFYLQHLSDSIYEALDDDCLFLTNCLSEMPTTTASELDDDYCVVGFSAIGLYTGNRVIEIARAIQTKPVYVQRALDFLSRIGLQGIEVPEVPGLILGRIVAMLVNEAASALMEGVATPEDIDTAMQLGTNYPRGPLAWGDYIGLDVVLATLNHLQDEFGEDRYSAVTLLTRMVDAGKLGRKTGEGFFSYHPETLLR